MAGWGGDEAGASGSRQRSSGKMAIAGRGGLQGKRGALGQAEVRRRVLEGTGVVQDQKRRSLWAGSRRFG